jgi:phage portal protein BeeE
MDDTEERRAAAWWSRLRRSLGTLTNRIGFLGGNLRYQELGLRPSEMALSEGRLQDRLDVCHAMGIRPEVLGVKDGNYATLRERRMEFYEDTIIPRVQWLERAFNSALAARGVKGKLTFNLKDIPAMNRLTAMTQESGWRKA